MLPNKNDFPVSKYFPSNMNVIATKASHRKITLIATKYIKNHSCYIESQKLNKQIYNE